MNLYDLTVMRQDMTEPDCGARIIVRMKDTSNVATFNGGYEVWTARHEAEVQACLVALNGLRFKPQSDDE